MLPPCSRATPPSLLGQHVTFHPQDGATTRPQERKAKLHQLQDGATSKVPLNMCNHQGTPRTSPRPTQEKKAKLLQHQDGATRTTSRFLRHKKLHQARRPSQGIQMTFDVILPMKSANVEWRNQDAGVCNIKHLHQHSKCEMMPPHKRWRQVPRCLLLVPTPQWQLHKLQATSKMTLRASLHLCMKH